MRYDYDMLGAELHQTSMDAGERWILKDVVGKPVRAWNSRFYSFRTEYDALRRPIRSFLSRRRSLRARTPGPIPTRSSSSERSMATAPIPA